MRFREGTVGASPERESAEPVFEPRRGTSFLLCADGNSRYRAMSAEQSEFRW